MEFQYERITERDKNYWSNDFDKTSYASLYVRLEILSILTLIDTVKALV